MNEQKSPAQSSDFQHQQQPVLGILITNLGSPMSLLRIMKAIYTASFKVQPEYLLHLVFTLFIGYS